MNIGPDFSTYKSRQSQATQDTILGNNKAVHNVIMKPGPLTESDHIPIIYTLTTRGVTKPTRLALNIRKPNWESLKVQINTDMEKINVHNK